MQNADNLIMTKTDKAIKPCRNLSYLMEPAGIEPATSGLQSLAQGGPFTDNIRIYTGFAGIRGPVMRANTDQIRI